MNSYAALTILSMKQSKIFRGAVFWTSSSSVCLTAHGAYADIPL
nr:MAG TPA: hypothetical protein [Caudoviricetes sp.]